MLDSRRYGATMKLLTSRNGSYLTGDDIADAVMHYGLELALPRELDIVDIPFVADDGAVRRVQLTVGWLADTAAVTHAQPVEELVESDTASSIRYKADHVGVVRATPFSEDEHAELGAMYFDPSAFR